MTGLTAGRPRYRSPARSHINDGTSDQKRSPFSRRPLLQTRIPYAILFVRFLFGISTHYSLADNDVESKSPAGSSKGRFLFFLRVNHGRSLFRKHSGPERTVFANVSIYHPRRDGGSLSAAGPLESTPGPTPSALILTIYICDEKTSSVSSFFLASVRNSGNNSS